MKKFISALLVAALALSLFTGCGKKEDTTTIYVYNWGQYIAEGDDDSIDVIAEFEKKYPNIKVQYSTFDSNETMYAKLKNGGITVDVVIPSDYMIGRMRQEGMLQELNYDNIPNAQYIDDAYRGLSYDPEDKYSVPYTWGTVGIIYNSKYVDEADVTGWELLWNEKYAGKITDVRQLPGCLWHCRVSAGLLCEHYRFCRAPGLRRQAGRAEACGAAVRYGPDLRCHGERGGLHCPLLRR